MPSMLGPLWLPPPCPQTRAPGQQASPSSQRSPSAQSTAQCSAKLPGSEDQQPHIQPHTQHLGPPRLAAHRRVGGLSLPTPQSSKWLPRVLLPRCPAAHRGNAWQALSARLPSGVSGLRFHEFSICKHLLHIKWRMSSSDRSSAEQKNQNKTALRCERGAFHLQQNQP